MRDKRICIVSNAPWAATGYGGQSKQLMERLNADGWEVAMSANWGLTGAPMETEWGKIYPQGAHPYSLDVIDLNVAHWFGGEPGLVITLYDTWPLLDVPDLLRKHHAYYWAPVDHVPVPPKVRAFAEDHDIIAMANFGAEQLTAAGVPPVTTIPHAIETSIFKPTESDVRERMHLPAGAHLTVAANANIGQSPVRKCWFENLLGWRIFAEKHDDAYLYIHTALQHPRGVDLASFIKLWGLPRDRLRIVDQAAYMGGFVSQGELAKVFSAADVLLAATAGEGFGLTPLEAQACGTPAIVTDFSAQIEVVGDCGWRMPFTSIWDYQQGGTQASPDVNAIAAALDASYTMSKDPAATDAMREKCVAHAAQYDADKVYEEQWRPFLDAYLDPPPKPNRQQRRAQKRRKR